MKTYETTTRTVLSVRSSNAAPIANRRYSRLPVGATFIPEAKAFGVLHSKVLTLFLAPALMLAATILQSQAGALLFNYYGSPPYPSGGNALTNLTVGDPNYPSSRDFS